MNIQSVIVFPNNCKPGDLIWACRYSQNHETKKIYKMPPTYGILTLTNSFEDESTTTGLPPQGINFILSAYACYHAEYQGYQPRYFVPIVSGRIIWKHAMALSTVILARNQNDCEAIYQERYETVTFEEEKNPYLLLSKLHMEHPNIYALDSFYGCFRNGMKKNTKTIFSTSKIKNSSNASNNTYKP